jgi:hypothetical protein
VLNKCPYYVESKGCSHMNDDDLGECIYEDGIIKVTAITHCSQGKKYMAQLGEPIC